MTEQWQGFVEELLSLHHDARGTLGALIHQLNDPDCEPRAIADRLREVAMSLGTIQRGAGGYLLVEEPRKRVNVPFVVRQSASALQCQFPEVGLHVDVPHSTEAWVCGGARGCGRVIENAVLNAIEGTGGCGASQVLVRTSSVPDYVVVSVADDGPGMPTAERHKPGHLGVGMRSMEAIVRRSGGQIRWRTHAAGTVLVMLLPAAGATP